MDVLRKYKAAEEKDSNGNSRVGNPKNIAGIQ